MSTTIMRFVKIFVCVEITHRCRCNKRACELYCGIVGNGCGGTLGWSVSSKIRPIVERLRAETNDSDQSISYCHFS